MKPVKNPPRLLSLLASALAPFLLPAVLTLALTSCASWTSQDTLTAIKIADAVCVETHQDLPDTEIGKICGVTDAVVKAVVGPARAESARHAADAARRAEAARCVAEPAPVLK
jgi:hypothetical protein